MRQYLRYCREHREKLLREVAETAPKTQILDILGAAALVIPTEQTPLPKVDENTVVSRTLRRHTSPSSALIVTLSGSSKITVLEGEHNKALTLCFVYIHWGDEC